VNAFTRGQLLKELAARGYRDDGSSPFRSIVRDYDEIELGELLEQMVARRERSFAPSTPWARTSRCSTTKTPSARSMR
jgi:hypothetical protein